MTVLLLVSDIPPNTHGIITLFLSLAVDEQEVNARVAEGDIGFVPPVQ